MNNWYIYIVRCSDNSLYTGIAKDVKKRVEEHNSNDLLGAKYTKYRRPVKLVYFEIYDTRSEATRREITIKRLPKKNKERLVGGNS
ncbi:MAG: GIY-YIG nuclease family protein [Calditrichia bacterium]|nr:GIY-YIG nuclease family protein [Calditrichia bacterium]